jgi:UDP-N-acetylglucosamine 2-epimerase (non-hydrolysing)
MVRKKKILTVIGTRPQFVKVAPVMKAFASSFDQVLVHTGQHYDDPMSKDFFEDLSLPSPDFNLGVGSGTHAAQTAAMMAKLEEVVSKEGLDLVLVYGDTNSTLAAALVAAKLTVRLAHVEAGLRSFDRAMPEEINRVVTDTVSDYLFCPTTTAMNNLRKEGLAERAFLVGDVMIDAMMMYLPVALSRQGIIKSFGVSPREYYLATVHRASNTDDVDALGRILNAFSALDFPVVFPVHPRTRDRLKKLGSPVDRGRVYMVDPVGYLSMLALEQNARKILTDSGGVQKEAYVLGTPCVTLRKETEWVETVDEGWNRLVGTDVQAIVDAARDSSRPASHKALFGDGHAAEKICQTLQEVLA